jgi:hypothetical protein
MTIITKRISRHLSFSFTRELAVCTLLILLAAGCTSARSNLGTSDSSCYLALPAATKAVGSHGRLLGVHLFTLTELRHQAPKLTTAISPKGPSSERVCVIAFSGHFRASTMTKPHGRPAGQVAIAVMTTPSNKLLGTVILRRIPLRFSHSHIG